MSDFPIKYNNTLRLFDFEIFSGTLNDISLENKYQYVINTINAYSYVVSKKDVLFKEALVNSDLLLPDGFPIVLALRVKKKIQLKKIAGEDIFLHLLNAIDNTSGKVFFLGSSRKTLSCISNRLKSEYPKIESAFFSPPYKESFSDFDSKMMIEAINNFKPDILYVGMTAPKQEKWVFTNYKSIDAKIICSIGAVFDFYAGTIKRPSNFWISLRLEWFIRLLNEPKRLWKRYLLESPQFIYDIFFKRSS